MKKKTCSRNDVIFVRSKINNNRASEKESSEQNIEKGCSAVGNMKKGKFVLKGGKKKNSNAHVDVVVEAQGK